MVIFERLEARARGLPTNAIVNEPLPDVVWLVSVVSFITDVNTAFEHALTYEVLEVLNKAPEPVTLTPLVASTPVPFEVVVPLHDPLLGIFLPSHGFEALAAKEPFKPPMAIG